MLLSLKSNIEVYIQNSDNLCTRYFHHIIKTHICCSNYSPERHSQFAYFSKALSRLSSSGDYKRTRQEALATLLLYLYKYKMVHATIISTGPYVHVSTSCSITKATMPYTCALMSYSLISAVHTCCYSARMWTDFRFRVSGQEQDSS